jgi:hypothetical protein
LQIPDGAVFGDYQLGKAVEVLVSGRLADRIADRALIALPQPLWRPVSAARGRNK